MAAINATRDDIVPYSEHTALLFHGVKSGLYEEVLEQGLDQRLGNQGSFGRGIYFADNPSKSAGYANGSQQSQFLICAVHLGDCVSAIHGQYPREPPKPEPWRRRSNNLFFDSLLGTYGGGQNEFVIFQNERCCPMYMVTFKNSNQVSGIPEQQWRQLTPPFLWHPNGQKGPALQFPWCNFAKKIFRKNKR